REAPPPFNNVPATPPEPVVGRLPYLWVLRLTLSNALRFASSRFSDILSIGLGLAPVTLTAAYAFYTRTRQHPLPREGAAGVTFIAVLALSAFAPEVWLHAFHGRPDEGWPPAARVIKPYM